MIKSKDFTMAFKNLKKGTCPECRDDRASMLKIMNINTYENIHIMYLNKIS